MNKPIKKVLFCDDDEGIVDVVNIILEDKGYKVLALTNSSTIFQVIRKQKPDVILLDLWMPGLGGQDITRILKSQGDTKGIPVVIISANKDTHRIAKEVGADEFLTKPFDIDDLERVVEKHANRTVVGFE